MLVRLAISTFPATSRESYPGLLNAPDLILETKRPSPRVWRRVDRMGVDIVVLHQSLLPDPASLLLTPLREITDAPWVVVLADGDDAGRQAALLAAGCEAVLTSALPTAELEAVLLALADKRRELGDRARGTGQGPAAPGPRLSDFVSSSVAMQQFMQTVHRVVGADAPLLIQGETGVGKERLSRAIHVEGPRRAGPFVAINCGALPDGLLESELFGHEEGAFTGATRSRRGMFELAHGGTLFLDEVGETPAHLQVKLLRALQEREIQRVGGERPIRVDVRIVAATNKDLATEVHDGRFRRDLFYRLCVVQLTLPPLRERPEDVPELVESYVEELHLRIGSAVRHVSSDALQALAAYSWPGNIRELANVIERAMLLCSADTLTLFDLPEVIAPRRATPAGVLSAMAGPGRASAGGSAGGRHGTPAGAPGPSDDWLDRPWKEVRAEALELLEREYLRGILTRAQGRVGAAAERAGMDPRSLYDKLRRHGLRKSDFRD